MPGEHVCQGQKRYPKELVTKILPNFRVNFVVRDLPQNPYFIG